MPALLVPSLSQLRKGTTRRQGEKAASNVYCLHCALTPAFLYFYLEKKKKKNQNKKSIPSCCILPSKAEETLEQISFSSSPSNTANYKQLRKGTILSVILHLCCSASSPETCSIMRRCPGPFSHRNPRQSKDELALALFEGRVEGCTQSPGPLTEPACRCAPTWDPPQRVWKHVPVQSGFPPKTGCQSCRLTSFIYR